MATIRNVSQEYLQAVRGSHSVQVRAIVTDSYQEGVSPTGTEIPVLDGQVELDETAEIRSTLDLTTDGARSWPTRASSALAPYGVEVHVSRGLVLAGGTVEWVSLGFFRVNSVEQDEPPDGPIRIEGTDRMAGLIDGRLLRPVQFAKSATYGAVVEQLVTEVYPEASVDWDDDSDLRVLGRSVIAEEDRHGFLETLVRSLGKIWYWDHRGRLQIKDPPDPSTPVFDVDHGAGGVLVSMSRKLSRDGVHNVVVVLGEGADTEAPVLAIRADVNPRSPTYVFGRFGPVPRFFATPFVNDKPLGQKVATSLVRQQLGLPYSVDFSMVPNVALEPLDPVRVRYSDRDGAEVHVLRRLTIPLTPEGAMDATTREQTVVLIGDV